MAAGTFITALSSATAPSHEQPPFALGLRRAGVEQGRQMGACRMAHEDEAAGIPAPGAGTLLRRHRAACIARLRRHGAAGSMR